MAIFRGLVTLNMTSNLFADASTNTWYFDAPDLVELDQAYIALRNFYIEIFPRISNLVNEANVTVEFYQLSDPKPRTPVLTYTMSGLTGGNAAGPTEVAACVSYQGAKVSGLPQSRRRGRVYIGPLSTTTDRPSAAFVTDLRDAGANLLAASVLSSTWKWAQFSPTNNAGIDVTDGWVDDEWDTQRRRGRKSTFRDTF